MQAASLPGACLDSQDNVRRHAASLFLGLLAACYLALAFRKLSCRWHMASFPFWIWTPLLDSESESDLDLDLFTLTPHSIFTALLHTFYHLFYSVYIPTNTYYIHHVHTILHTYRQLINTINNFLQVVLLFDVDDVSPTERTQAGYSRTVFRISGSLATKDMVSGVSGWRQTTSRRQSYGQSSVIPGTRGLPPVITNSGTDVVHI